MTEPKRKATYEDIVAAPEDEIAEILDGELVLSPRPRGPHAISLSMLGADLVQGFGHSGSKPGAPGGWWIVDEPEVHLGEDVLVPDLAGWRRERMPFPPASEQWTITPDWVCEILSPSTVRIDRLRKTRIYARAGVAHLWLVDPVEHVIEVYGRAGASSPTPAWLVLGGHAGEGVFRAEPFESIDLDSTEWWLPRETP